MVSNLTYYLTYLYYIEADILLADTATQGIGTLFKEDLNVDSDSDKEDVHKVTHNIDGSKGNLWNFNSQIKVDAVSKFDSIYDDTTNEASDAVPETIQDKVKLRLKVHNIEMPEMAELMNQSEKLNLEHQMAAQAGNAKEHYDKDDLIMFHELMLSKPLVRACSELEYEHPTVIQRMAVPAVLEGHDIMAHSVTGSGKTAAYLLPIMQKYL